MLTTLGHPCSKPWWLFAAASLIVSCSAPEEATILESGRPAFGDLNVILVTIDTLRADYVGATAGSGGARAETPHLDAFAEEGVVFERCVAQTPLTLPSHTSLLSGTYPLHHRIIDNGGFTVPQELELVSEVLRGNGFETSAFVSAFVLHSKWGINQGFDTYSDDFDRAAYDTMALQNDRPAEVVLAEAKNWLRANKDSRFFSWIHLFEPHSPYRPPPPFDRYPEDPYRGEVEYVDHVLGDFVRFLREEGLYDESLVIVTSDHGEALGQHGEGEHGFFVYEPTVRVPLIVRAPAEFPVKRVRELVELVDLAPTILDVLGVEIPESYQGESLFGEMMGVEGAESKTAYAETFYPRLHYGWSELRALYKDDWKYIWAPEEELYNLSEDPSEQQNLVGSHLDERNALRSELRRLVDEGSERALTPAASDLDPDDRRRLEALGYLTGGDASARSGPRVDPKSQIAVVNDLERAGDLIESGRADEGLSLLTPVLAAQPDIALAHALRGDAFQAKRIYDEALASYREVLRLKPDDNFAKIDVVTSLVNLGRFDEAIEEADRYLAAHPRDHDLLEMAGLAYYFKGNHERAAELLEEAVRLEESSSALSKLGEIHAMRGNFTEASGYIQRALATNPQSKGANYALALIEEARGNLASAVDYYKQELEHHPDDFRAAFNLANDLRQLGRLDEAVEYYRATIRANPKYNAPYFMIAQYYVEQNRNLDEAIALCKRGIEIEPADQLTLLGYRILIDIYVRRSDKANYDSYFEKAEKLYERLKESGQLPVQ